MSEGARENDLSPFLGVSQVCIANQLGRRNLDQSQKAALALRLEKQLAEAAKLRRRATQNNNAGRSVVSTLIPQEQGKARDLTAKMVGVSAGYS